VGFGCTENLKMKKLAQVVIKTPRDVLEWHTAQVAHYMDLIKKLSDDPRVRYREKLLQKHLDLVQFHQTIVNILQQTAH
jgi:phage gp36-like protein